MSSNDNDDNDNDNNNNSQKTPMASSTTSTSTSTQPTPPPTKNNCSGCGITFPSRNALFRHLKEAGDKCIKLEDQDDFHKYVRSTSKATKVVLLYGYLPYEGSTTKSTSSTTSNDTTTNINTSSSPLWKIENGNDAGHILLQAIDWHQQQLDNPNNNKKEGGDGGDEGYGLEIMEMINEKNDSSSSVKINRSYGNISRNVEVVAQDNGTGATTEVMSARLHPLPAGCTVEQWIDKIQDILNQHFQLTCCLSSSTTTATITPIRLLGRQDMNQARFNAEMDVNHRRVEYILPLSFLRYSTSLSLLSASSPSKDHIVDYDTLETTLPAFDENQKNSFTTTSMNLRSIDTTTTSDNTTTTTSPSPTPTSSEHIGHGKRPSSELVHYLYGLKKTMQHLTTKIVQLDLTDEGAVLEKEFHLRKRRQHKALQQQEKKKKKQEQKKKEKNKKKQQQEGQVQDEDVQERNQNNNNNNNNDKGNTNKNDDNKNGNNTDKKDRNDQDTSNNNDNNNTTKSTTSPDDQQPQPPPKQGLLKRKRFHNFTPKVMAHEYLAYRRLDRFYHRATLRFPTNPNQKVSTNESSLNPTSTTTTSTTTTTAATSYSGTTPFLVLSLAGDLFLTGQVCRIVGLFLALANGFIDTDFCDCVFDEDYPHLIPTPPAPTHGMIASVAFYMQWEGKTKSILTPRLTDRYEKGWNQVATLQRVNDWQNCIYQEIANKWLQPQSSTVDTTTTGRLAAEQEWTDTVLRPWAETAKIQLEEYRQWKKARESTPITTTDTTLGPSAATAETEKTSIPPSLPPLESVDPSIPEQFEKVVHLLRKADESGMWPSTSLKRQLVISTEGEQQQQETEIANDATAGESTATTNKKPDSLSMARMKAKFNKEERSSAYAYVEGRGGASGSFSVGSMPKMQPKGNELFPELVKAAFELELLLCPDREPSSTIAINRNAQFRPHTDSGAGAGQSTSLIVGLGTYAGGDLVVEGEKRDIRYKASEFNGWTQRHWTMPFVGERYSLVWFTPKGCEGMRGIDLDLNLGSSSCPTATTTVSE